MKHNLYDGLSPIKQLDLFRNLHYADGNATQNGIIANAINEILPEYNRRGVEIKKLRQENELLSKNAAEAFQEGLNENRELFTEEILKEFGHFLIRRAKEDGGRVDGVVESQYVAAFLENVEFAHDCGIPVAPKDDELYELLIKAMPKLAEECVKRFAVFLLERAEGNTIETSDLPELVKEFREESGK